MGANTIQVSLLRQRCKRWDSSTRIVPKPPDNVSLVRKLEICAYPSWSRFTFFCALFEWCVVVGGRPVPGSHPSSRQSYGELTQRSDSPAGSPVPLPATRGATGSAIIAHSSVESEPWNVVWVRQPGHQRVNSDLCMAGLFKEKNKVMPELIQSSENVQKVFLVLHKLKES